MRSLKFIWECLTVWSVPPTSLQGAQAILVHASGENSVTDPGLVNWHIASVVVAIYCKLPNHVPVFAQGEVVSCLFDLGIPIAAASPTQAASAPRYLSTRDIALWQKAECEKRGITKVVVVSYIPHHWRAIRAAEKVGLDVLVPAGLKEIYDESNSQWWARYKFINRSYEILIRLWFLTKGWI